MTAESVRIDRLANGGDGVGRLADGCAVFVPRTAPGDLVELAGLRRQRRFARARIGRLVEAGPHRVSPRCHHFLRDECGGCQLQHLELAAQLGAKGGFIGDALRRLGGLTAVDPEVVAPADPFGYRAKVTLTRGAGGQLGMHRQGRAHEIFPLTRCEIAAPPLQRLWDQLRPHLKMLPRHLVRLVLRLDPEGGRHLVVVTRVGPAWTGGPALATRLAPAAAPADSPVTVWWRPEDGAPRVVAGGEEPYPATVFEQINPAMGHRVRAGAVAALGPVTGRHLWDLYAGIGETSALLAAQGATVESVEADGRAVALAERRARLEGLGSVRRYAGRAEEVVRRLARPDAVVTNPPRAGMHRSVTDELIRRGPARIVYVSCDPATLARDCARLSGYRLADLQAYDLFPQTAHVESVAVLTRA